MSIFSFLFSASDTGSERGAKTDGKEIAELKAENNVDAAKNLKQAKNIVSDNTKTTVIQDNKKQRQERHVQRLNTPYRRRSQRNDRKYPQERHIEIQNITTQAKTETKTVKKSTDAKTISDFINKLDPSVQEAIKNDIIKTISQKNEQINQNQKVEKAAKVPQTQALRPSKKTNTPEIEQTQPKSKRHKNKKTPKPFQKQLDTRFVKDQNAPKIPQAQINLRPNQSEQKKDLRTLVEEKRGSNREPKRIKMLRAAKQVAEKARQIVKDFRLRITGKVKQVPVQKSTIKQKQRSMPQNNIKNMSRTNRGR